VAELGGDAWLDVDRITMMIGGDVDAEHGKSVFSIQCSVFSAPSMP
jgi:hypothetical protein